MKWDYKALGTKTTGFLGGKLDLEAFEKSLNELGREGWELVAAFDTNAAQGQSREVVVLFKKPR